MVIAICLNCLLAVFISWLAWGLWQWRCALAQVNRQWQIYEIEMSLAPKQASYDLARRRFQLVAARLRVGQWQQRSRQIQQILQLVQFLRTVVVLRNSRR